ncbi:MAG TPA: NAD(P)H-dependent oxidoreductase, partial [Bacteroidia bacterium]|nr:NAD(P)H-dependent oxidoreductase [Bacteroidia bacterium]
MITIISGTNKADSLTRVISSIYYNRLRSLDSRTRFLSLEDINYNFITGTMYHKHESGIERLQEQIFNPSKKFVFVVPEYNGSIPGVLKLLIDALDVRPAFSGKKAALTGIATGRAGNLRGLDHMSSILQRMHVTGMPHMLPISRGKDEL